MAAPIVVARVATGLLGEDLGRWAVRLGLLALLAAAVPMALAMLAFAALLGLANGLSGAPAGGGPLRGGPPTQAALAAIPPDQLALMQQVAAELELPPALDRAGRHRRHRERLRRQHGHLLGRRHRLRPVPALDLGPAGHRQRRQPVRLPRRAAGHGPLPVRQRRRPGPARRPLGLQPRRLVRRRGPQKADRYGGLGASGGGLVAGWSNAPALNQYDERNYLSAAMWQQWHAAACSAAALDWLLGAYGVRLGGIDQAIALIGPNTGISTTLGLAGRHRPAAGAGRSPPAGSARATGRCIRSASWRPGWTAGRWPWTARSWFGEGHWFVATGYDQNGIYIRDSSGWDTRYLTWSRLYGEVGFSGWVVGVQGGG